MLRARRTADPERTPHRRPVPLRALGLSVAALAIPVLATMFRSDWLEREGALLIWLPALLPAFLLTYYRGWHGASAALAGGMATLALTQVELILLDLPIPGWNYVFVVIVVLLAVSIGAGWMAELLLRAREGAEEAALTDTLTGLPNRRHAMLILDTAWAGALRGAGLSVVMFDIDHFKQVNDTHGHAAGDRVLWGFADVLRKRARQMDLSARIGGEEFISILLDCPIDRAEAFAEDVRAQLSALHFGWGQVTASAGIATVEAGMGSPDVLIAAADRALYAAKDQGRNRVCRAEVSVRRPVATRPAEPRALDELRVLVVDDDPMTLRATRRLLERLGPSVTSADSARSALRVVATGEPIDLLVTDIVMPEMSGFALVDLLTRANPDLPVLYMSGYAQADVNWGGTPGARSTFLSKPLEFDDLEAAVKGLLDPSPLPAESVVATSDAAVEDGGTSKPERGGERRAEPSGRILVVDDDPSSVRSLLRLLRRVGYRSPIGLTNPAEVAEVVRDEEIDLVILDLNMPEIDGFQVMAQLGELTDPEEYLPILVVTGAPDIESRRRALTAGAMDFLAKPFDTVEAQARVRNLLATRALTRRVSDQRDDLETRVRERTAELADTRAEILHRLAHAAEYRDDSTGRHAERVGVMSSLIAAELGMGTREVDLVRRTAPLHDVGKIGVPDEILRKAGPLTDSEFELMKSHCVIGAQILGGSQHEILKVAARIASGHHERWDGAGYPEGKAGDSIPIEARIVAVADVFDVLSHARPYKEPFPLEKAVAELDRCAGSQFDPDVIDAFTRIHRRVGLDDLDVLADPIDPLRDT